MNKKQLKFNINDKTKKNHIVPQVYLRYFQKSQDNDIYVYDKKSDKVFTSDISKVAAENKLYVIEDKSIDMYISWEDYYTQNVDNNINYVFKEILKNVQCTPNIKPLYSKNLKIKLINIILHQMLRTHEKIYSFFDNYPNEMEKIFEESKIQKLKEQYDIKRYKEILKKESSYKSFMLPVINNVANNDILKFILLNKTWTIFCNYTNMKFITSDRPVVLYNYEKKKVSIKNGIANKTTLLAYPISPKYMIVIFPNEYLGGALKIVNNFGRIPCENTDVIEAYNVRQILNASRQVYSSDKTVLNYLKRKYFMNI